MLLRVCPPVDGMEEVVDFVRSRPSFEWHPTGTAGVTMSASHLCEAGRSHAAIRLPVSYWKARYGPAFFLPMLQWLPRKGPPLLEE